MVTDCGLKYNILRQLRRRGCRVTVVPAATPADELLAMKPSGFLLSPGPGDPRMLDYVVDNARQILGRVPVMGICLGHQILGEALGGHLVHRDAVAEPGAARLHWVRAREEGRSGPGVVAGMAR